MIVEVDEKSVEYLVESRSPEALAQALLAVMKKANSYKQALEIIANKDSKTHKVASLKEIAADKLRAWDDRTLEIEVVNRR